MLQIAVVLAFVAVALGGKCDSPKQSATTYSTTDGFFHFHTTFVAEFALTCANNVRDVPFYAVIDNKIYPMAASEETSKYQVSWYLENDAASARTFNIKVYDEDGIAAYKKNPSTKPLFTENHNHAGLSKKSPISSETVALFIAVGALYYAIRQKSEINA